MKTNDIKQIMVTHFEEPINEVQEALDELGFRIGDAEINTPDRCAIQTQMYVLQKRLTNLQSLLPTIQ